MSVGVELHREFENLEEDAKNETISSILDEVKEDNRSIDHESALNGVRYLRELNENWGQYDEVEWFHGTKSINIETIIEEGLTPGEENNSSTGERINHGEVCLGRFPIALSYAKNGTPEPEQVQSHVDQAYEFYLGETRGIPDITNTAGREKFAEDTADVHWLGGWEALPEAIDNYEEIVEANKSDPMIIGTTAEGMVNPEEDAYQKKGMTDSELYFSDEIGSLFEVQADKVSPQEISIFVPHQKLDEFREDYGEEVNVLSIEAMQMKLDYENRDFYQEHGIIEYDEVWNPDSEYPMTLGSELGSYAPSALIPSTSG